MRLPASAQVATPQLTSVNVQPAHTVRPTEPLSRVTLIHILRIHGVPCRATEHRTLRVASQESGSRGSSWRVCEIAPTLHAVRAFLGYGD